MAERKVKQWITVNGVHVPIFEGESKADAIKRSIEKQKSNVKANEDQKAKDIARNKAEKDTLNKKDTTKPKQSEVQTSDDSKFVVDHLNGDRISAQMYEKVNGKWTKIGKPETWASKKEFEEEYGKLKEVKNADSGKAIDKVKESLKKELTSKDKEIIGYYAQYQKSVSLDEAQKKLQYTKK